MSKRIKLNHYNKVVVMKVVRFHDSQVCQTVQDYEQYAYVYSKTISEEIYHDDDVSIDQYVKITRCSKTIYRKCAARKGVKSNEISLGNRSIKELGLKRKDLGVEKVCISKSNWFLYHFYNSDVSFRMLFIIALIGLISSLASLLNDIISLFF